MKKTLRISPDMVGEYIIEFCGQLEHVNNPVHKTTIDIDYIGFDWKQKVLVFNIEHPDIVEDVEIPKEKEDEMEK